jgi:carbon storage regulator
MLVLSRKKNESLVLGPSDREIATVTVIEIRGDKVRLGIEMPKEWMLHRQEVWTAIRQDAAGGNTPSSGAES